MGNLLVNNLIMMLVAAHCVAAESPMISRQAKVVVAVIDTGIDESLLTSPILCKTGHKDFTGLGLKDNHGHGTHIAGIIEQYAKGMVLDKHTPLELDKAKADFCIIVIKYFDPRALNQNNLKNTIKSFEWAIAQGADVINYSGGGTSSDDDEKKVVLKALNMGIKFVAAAGNERSDIDKFPYYPAMYDNRIIRVGNLVDSKVHTIASSSNYGKSINTWEVGTGVMSRLPGKTFGTMTGTSQACAVKSGKIVNELLTAK